MVLKNAAVAALAVAASTDGATVPSSPWPLVPTLRIVVVAARRASANMPSTFPSRSVMTIVHGFAERRCCRSSLLQDRLDVGCCELGGGKFGRVPGACQAGCWYGVRIVWWPAADITDADAHSVAFEVPILDSHQHVTCLREIFWQTNDQRIAHG